MEKDRMIYTDLDAWKEARVLAKLVYTSMSKFPKDEIFALQSQIKRAAISIPSNIAEGSGRNHGKDSLQFFLYRPRFCLRIRNTILPFF
ncbi:four helix bundle protein [Mucilaginibacter sp. NFX135]|uniref:four helix bundle protein n=1 Tax=Mucilaginibacter sp. NFX135 TaxID=3402687 RepID=UPI003AFA77AC